MFMLRDLPSARGPEYTFGTTDCYEGYEGNVDDLDYFTTCHQTIYNPSKLDKVSLTLIITFSVLGFVACVIWFFLKNRLRKRWLMQKIERRRSKRSSEESILLAKSGAFNNT
jgi:hypothetical protein